MKCSHLSSSKVGTFNKCEFSYYLEYVKGISNISKSLVFGRLVHTVLENVGLVVSEARIDPDDETGIEEAVRALWAESKAALDQLEKVEIEDHDEEEYFNMVTGAIFRRGINFFIENSGTEQKFEITLSNGIKIHGIFDVVIDHGDTLEILDWKTSKTIPKYEALQTDHQLRIYDLAAAYQFPDKERLITIDFLRRGPMTVVFSDRQRQETENFLMEEYLKILSCEKPQRTIGWKCKAMCIGRDSCKRYWDAYKGDF